MNDVTSLLDNWVVLRLGLVVSSPTLTKYQARARVYIPTDTESSPKISFISAVLGPYPPEGLKSCGLGRRWRRRWCCKRQWVKKCRTIGKREKRCPGKDLQNCHQEVEFTWVLWCTAAFRVHFDFPSLFPTETWLMSALFGALDVHWLALISLTFDSVTFRATHQVKEV